VIVLCDFCFVRVCFYFFVGFWVLGKLGLNFCCDLFEYDDLLQMTLDLK